MTRPLTIASSADYRRQDYIADRVRSDIRYRDFVQSKRIISKAEVITRWGIYIAVACLGLVVAMNIGRVFAALTN